MQASSAGQRMQVFINGGRSTAECTARQHMLACARVDASLISRLKEMDDENRRLKKMYAEAQMQNDVLKEALGKNVWSAPFLQG